MLRRAFMRPNFEDFTRLTQEDIIWMAKYKNTSVKEYLDLLYADYISENQINSFEKICQNNDVLMCLPSRDRTAHERLLNRKEYIKWLTKEITKEECLAMGRIGCENSIQFALDLLGLTKHDWLAHITGECRHYQERQYRRGYHHGFGAARESPKTTEQEVSDWKDEGTRIGPPGSPMAGQPFSF